MFEKGVQKVRGVALCHARDYTPADAELLVTSVSRALSPTAEEARVLVAPLLAKEVSSSEEWPAPPAATVRRTDSRGRLRRAASLPGEADDDFWDCASYAQVFEEETAYPLMTLEEAAVRGGWERSAAA